MLDNVVTEADFFDLWQVHSVGPKLLALKFIETYVLHFTLDSNGSGTYNPEGNTSCTNINKYE